MNDLPQAVQKRGFFYGLLSDENGAPDEANVAFVMAFIVIVAGAAYNAWIARHFDLLAFAGAVGALIPIYRVSRGDLRRGQSDTAPGATRGCSNLTAP